MPTNNFEAFYENIKDRIAPMLSDNPCFKDELKRIYLSFNNDDIECRLENNGRKIIFNDCHTDSNYINKSTRVLKMVTISSSIGEIMVDEMKNHTTVNDSLPNAESNESQLFDIFLQYTYRYFDKDGLEIEHCGMSTKLKEICDVSFFLNYSIMYHILMKYRPLFMFGNTPQCPESVNKETTSTYCYNRSNSNLAMVGCTVNICREQIDDDTNALYYDDSCHEQKLMINPRDLNGPAIGFYIKGQYLLSGRPQYLNFNPQHILSGDEINSGIYNAPYFLKQVEAFLGDNKGSSPLYESLMRRGKQQLVEEEKRLIKKD